MLLLLLLLWLYTMHLMLVPDLMLVLMLVLLLTVLSPPSGSACWRPCLYPATPRASPWAQLLSLRPTTRGSRSLL